MAGETMIGPCPGGCHLYIIDTEEDFLLSMCKDCGRLQLRCVECVHIMLFDGKDLKEYLCPNCAHNTDLRSLWEM